MNKQYLENYAELAVRIGANVKKGQPVNIASAPEDMELARMVMKKCYEAGASIVNIIYNDSVAKHSLLENAPEDELQRFPQWKIDQMLDCFSRGGAYINIISEHPDLLSDIDAKRINMADLANRKASREVMSEYILGGKTRWCLINTPNPEWAKKVFPNLSEDEAVEELWKNLFMCSRADQADPLKAWEEHLKALDSRKGYLNEKQYDKLIYKAKGTDLEVGLVENHIWMGGSNTATNGESYLPNIPTEEVFTTPHKTRINGTLQSSLPLSYNGNIIDNFSFTFKDGKIVDFTAETGYDILKDMITVDEGAGFLGEVALVPYDSPIKNSGVTYFSTLYDENASCHFAVGAAYLLSIENGPSMSEEEKVAKGINTSLTHVDFMVGSKDLSITGVTKDGKEEPIFIDGDWAF